MNYFILKIFYIYIYIYSLLLESIFFIEFSVEEDAWYDEDYCYDEDDLDFYELNSDPLDPLDPWDSLEEFIDDENFLYEYDDFFLVLHLLRTIFFFSFFLYGFQFFAVKFFIFLSLKDKRFFYRFNFVKIQFKKCIEKFYQFYKQSSSISFSFVSFFQLLDWCYNHYPIKTFLIGFYIISCLTFNYMHYFEVGFHFYEFFDSLLYFFINFVIVKILLFFFFVFSLNFYGFCIWFSKLNRVYHYVFFFSLIYILSAYPFYFFFDLIGISLIDIVII